MMHVLFNGDRRREIRGAILSGKPISFRSKEPKSDDADSRPAIDKEAYFEGHLIIGENMKLGGFGFVYRGGSDGEAELEIRCGGSRETKRLPLGKETAIDYASEGTRLRITPVKEGGFGNLVARIDLERI
jgi:hypothetical protein